MYRRGRIVFIRRDFLHLEQLEDILFFLAEGQGERALSQLEEIELLARFQDLLAGLVFGLVIAFDEQAVV